MSFKVIQRLGPIFMLAVVCATSIALFSGCTGGGGSGDDDIISGFNNRNIDLYSEAPPVYVTGNGDRKFYPKGDIEAGLCDMNGDGVPETKINDFASFVNAANNIFQEDIAACMDHGSQTNPLRDHYAKTPIWNTVNERPDLMPEYADGTGNPSTSETQYFQVSFPFLVDPASIFEAGNVGNNFLTDQITLSDQLATTVRTSVFIKNANGEVVDALGNVYDPNDPNWPAGVTFARNTIVFLANQSGQPLPSLPAQRTAFTSTNVPGRWSAKEFYVRIGVIGDDKGNPVNIDSKHMIRRTDVDVADDDTAVKVLDVLPYETIINPYTGSDLVDNWPGVQGTGEDQFVPTDVNFQIIFNKPVVPTTVGQSIVFNRAPFTGNMKALPNPQNLLWIPDPNCNPGGIEAICPNIALRAYFLDTAGNTYGVQTAIPVRIYPLSQNNLAKYIINPLIDLPGSSSDWSGDIPGEPPTPSSGDIRMRIEIVCYEYLQNTLTGDLDGPSSFSGETPHNLCVGGFHGERFFDGGLSYTKTFSVLRGKRYVNAPVSPNVVYYTMSTNGVGAIDLNGNGFTTNKPSVTRNMLVTATTYFNPFGNQSMGTGNDRVYPVGVGMNTPIPGVNEGSSGWFNDLDPAKDALVRDSYGSAQLYPDPDSNGLYVNISDVELGDFLDTIYYDRSNPYNSDQFHLDLIFTAAAGSFHNNMISSPPTPNPPPLSIPVGMRPVDIILDDLTLLEEGAFVIMGREVFPPDLTYIPLTGVRQWVQLDPAGIMQGADQPLPPAPPGLAPPWALGSYIQDGPLAETCTFAFAISYASRQQIGNFLFAADKTNNEVKVLNSNTMELITSIRQTIRGPDHVAVTPDLRTLYVSNASGGSVSVIDVDPRSSNFLYPKTSIPVGMQPKGISCQPDYEDVFVCNYGSNTVSIINPSTNTVRKTLTALIKKPWDIVTTPRQLGFGWGTETYYGYISNYGGDNVLVYESGPDGVGGVGYDDILDPVPDTGENGEDFESISKPRGLCPDPLYLHNQNNVLNLTGGCFVAHASSKGAAVSRVNFVTQQAPWGPIYLIPNSGSIGGTPGFGARQFWITSQWTAQEGYLSGFQDASDVTLPDFNRYAWLNQAFTANSYVTNYGAVGNNPSFQLPINNKHPIRVIGGTYVPCYYPDLLFVSYKSTKTIDVLDVTTGASTTITGLPAPAQSLKTFFKN